MPAIDYGYLSINKYQGKAVSVGNPGTKDVPEADLTRAQMASKMGSNSNDGVSSRTQDDILKLLKTYWLPNARRQLTSTFDSYRGAQHTIRVAFDRNLPNTFGANAWARTYYYGYGNQGVNNYMMNISIVLDLQDVLDTGAGGKVSGTGGNIKFDQILAHELMHAMMAEVAPGYMLGSTHTEWFTEGSAEMISGGMTNIGSKSASQLCANFGRGSGDYTASYLAVCYASWLSACKGYGGTCTVSAQNLAYGLDRIIAKLRETGDLNKALEYCIGTNISGFEDKVRREADGSLQEFLNKLIAASTNSEGTRGAGSVLGGNLKLQGEYVVSNKPSSLDSSNGVQFDFSKMDQYGTV